MSCNKDILAHVIFRLRYNVMLQLPSLKQVTSTAPTTESTLCDEWLLQWSSLLTGRVTSQVLLGQKYGYRPLPTIIGASEMEMLCDVITRDEPPGADVQLLRQWYKKDENSIEPIYVLQTISSILTNFKNKVNPTSVKLTQLLHARVKLINVTEIARNHCDAYLFYWLLFYTQSFSVSLHVSFNYA